MTIHGAPMRMLALVAGYAGASLVAHAYAAGISAALLPAIGYVVDVLLPDGVARVALAVRSDQGQDLTALEAALVWPLHVGGDIVPAGEPIDSSTLVAYALQHVALIYAVLIAWPVRDVAARAALLVLGLPVVTLVVLLDIPFVLAGLMHEALLEAGVADVASRGLAVYYQFLHRGGRLGLAVAAAVGLCLVFPARSATQDSHSSNMAHTRRS